VEFIDAETRGSGLRELAKKGPAFKTQQMRKQLTMDRLQVCKLIVDNRQQKQGPSRTLGERTHGED